jgi:hypothetical protein
VGDGMACIMMECNNDFGFHGDDYESSYAMWHCIVSLIYADILEEHPASFFKIEE